MTNIFNLEEYINKEKNKTAFVCGMGPSLKESLSKIKKEFGIIIACSDVDLMTELIPDYWVFANSGNSAVNMNVRWKKMKNTTIVHADSVDTTPREWVIENVTNNYVGYDQRHFDNKTCQSCPNGCSNFIKDRLTIQELLKKLSNHSKRYGTGHTVAVHCLALSILLGCNEIYISGVDLNYKLGYVDDKTSNGDSFDPWLPEILEDFQIINESAKLLNVKIYNLSDFSPLRNIFETKKL